ncbi:hypothetical protein L798_11783 [Zootermopsis nevadensis]|uniref:Odorant receptor n=2 Tax=Zootermopsis nevadensis TaxID=136037 RepID=A0A067R4J0_ZOONE|nr:hypothetical protein L798_11783 [Zootermopsis nevadensis]
MSATGNRQVSRECLDLNLMFLKLGSIFPLDKVSSSTWINILYKGYTTFTVGLFFSVSAAAPLFIICADYTLQDGIEVMSILLTQIRSGMKLITFIIYKKEIQNLILSLYKNFFIHGRNLSAEETSVVRETIDYTRKMTLGYIILYCTTALSMILHPLTFTPTDLEQESAFNQTARPQSSRPIPFKSWYPNWDITKSPQYEIEYLAQATLTALEAWCLACIDTFCVALMIYAGCQFDLLGLALKNMNKGLKFDIGAYQKRKKGSYRIKILTLNDNLRLSVITENVGNKPHTNLKEINRWSTSDVTVLQNSVVQFGWEDEDQRPSTVKPCTQDEIEAMMYIKKCIEHHHSLLIYVADMNTAFSTMFFVVFLTASILICLLGFQVIVMPPSGLMFIRVLLHSLCTVFELGFFCWYGSEVMHKSERVYQDAYESEWQDLSSGAKQFICMIIMRAQRPAAVRAGLFGDICLPTFTTLLKNAYSYLALLQQLHGGGA